MKRPFSPCWSIPSELDRLRDQLKVALPDLIEETSGRSRDRHPARGYRPGPGICRRPRWPMCRSRVKPWRCGRSGDGADSGPQPSSAAGRKAASCRPPSSIRSAPLPRPGRSGAPAEPEHGDGPGGGRRRFPRGRIAVGRRAAVSPSRFPARKSRSRGPIKPPRPPAATTG